MMRPGIFPDYMAEMLKGHSYGVTLCGKNHYGSYVKSNRMRPPVTNLGVHEHWNNAEEILQVYIYG